MGLEFSSHIFEKFSYTKFHGSPSNRTCGQTDRQTSRHDEANSHLLLFCERAIEANRLLNKARETEFVGTSPPPSKLLLLPPIPLSQLNTILCFLLFLLFPVPRMMTLIWKYEGKIRTVWAVNSRPELGDTVRYFDSIIKRNIGNFIDAPKNCVRPPVTFLSSSLPILGLEQISTCSQG
jgi:hypothetical protein